MYETLENNLYFNGQLNMILASDYRNCEHRYIIEHVLQLTLPSTRSEKIKEIIYQFSGFQNY